MRPAHDVDSEGNHLGNKVLEVLGKIAFRVGAAHAGLRLRATAGLAAQGPWDSRELFDRSKEWTYVVVEHEKEQMAYRQLPPQEYDKSQFLP